MTTLWHASSTSFTSHLEFGCDSRFAMAASEHTIGPTDSVGEDCFRKSAVNRGARLTMNGRHVQSLSDHQRELLWKYLDHYMVLAARKKKPQSPSGYRFLSVCDGKEEPQTDHEIAFVAYRKDLAEKAAQLRTAQRQPPPSVELRKKVVLEGNFHVGSRPVSSPTPLRSTPGFARKIAEPLGSREDFKRDSARNWARAVKPKQRPQARPV